MCWLIKVPRINGSPDEEMTEVSDGTDHEHDADGNSALQADVGPQPLTIMKARWRKIQSRQLVPKIFYTCAQVSIFN